MKKSEKKLQTSLKSILNFVLLSAIPTILSLFLWYLGVGLFKLWKFDFNLFLVAYGITILVFALLFSFVMVNIPEWVGFIEDKPKKKKSIPRGQKILRIIISGLIIPILFSLIATLVPVQGEETAATLFYRSIKSQPEYLFIEKIGDSVINSHSIDTKVAGINTLKSIHTEEAMEQLIRILDSTGCRFEEWTAPDYYLFSDSIGEAFASFGLEAIDPLLVIFNRCDDLITGNPSEMMSDIFSIYFEKSFDGLVEQLNDDESLSSSEKEDFLKKLNTIELQLTMDLLDLERETSLAGGFNVTETNLDLILETFNQMENLEKVSSIYELSRRIAADLSYGSSTRSKAIILMAKLGSRDDIGILLTYLEDDTEVIKKTALEAIAILNNKIEGIQETDTK
ncbi:hypothetical protein ACFLXB_00530 [Chloroflexota bacterium]